MANKDNRCYACGKQATTKEHSPPFGFFPKGFRENLITVPSCERHNNEQSNAVEYVRNVIAIHFSTNGLAREISKGKVKRSFEYNSVLKKKTFENLQPIILNGQKTGSFTVDLEQVQLIMKGIAYAMYYKQFNKPYAGSWNIFIDSATDQGALLAGQSDGFDVVREMINKVQYYELKMPQPKVFRCLFNAENENNVIFRFLFYEGFSVCAVSLPFYMKTE